MASRCQLSHDMNPSDPNTGGEDEALAAALAKRVAVPAAVLARLREERAQLGEKRVGSDNIVAFPSGAPSSAKRRLWGWMAAAAVIAVLGVVGYQMQTGSHGGTTSAIVARSPQGTVATTQPEIAWENTPGKNYNVWILPK